MEAGADQAVVIAAERGRVLPIVRDCNARDGLELRRTDDVRYRYKMVPAPKSSKPVPVLDHARRDLLRFFLVGRPQLERRTMDRRVFEEDPYGVGEVVFALAFPAF